jgi:hypothetical protein
LPEASIHHNGAGLHDANYLPGVGSPMRAIGFRAIAGRKSMSYDQPNSVNSKW